MNTMPTRSRRALLEPALFVAAVAFFFVAPELSGKTVSSYNVFQAFQTFAAFGLVALAVGLTMVLGEFDVSVLGLFPLGGVVAVKLGESSPYVGVLAAVACGVLVGVVHGGVIIRTKISSLTITFATAIVLMGVAGVLTDQRDVPYADYTVGINLDKQIATFLSLHSLITLVPFLLVAAVLRFTKFGPQTFATGGDVRAARSVGIRVNWLILGVFVVSGVLVTLCGALFAFGTATAQPDNGWAPLIFGASAALIGGVALHGGEGSATGVLFGALTLAFLQTSFTVLESPVWVPSVVQGTVLVLIAVVRAPGALALLQSARRNRAVRAAS
jgi:ribose/xylose/arabinose/galactoside ABC-type transport system permease subunit